MSEYKVFSDPARIAASMPSSPECVCKPAINPYISGLGEIRYHWGTRTESGLTAVGVTSVVKDGRRMEPWELDPDTCLALKHVLAQEGIRADSVVPMV